MSTLTGEKAGCWPSTSDVATTLKQFLWLLVPPGQEGGPSGAKLPPPPPQLWAWLIVWLISSRVSLRLLRLPYAISVSLRARYSLRLPSSSSLVSARVVCSYSHPVYDVTYVSAFSPLLSYRARITQPISQSLRGHDPRWFFTYSLQLFSYNI